jgi:hypothetical protein
MPKPPRFHVPSLLATTLVASAAAALAATAADHPWERIEVRSETGPRTIEAAVIVEAEDGGLLVERRDERYELLQPTEIAARGGAPAEPADETPRALGQRLLAELPAGFDVLVTRHYVVCFDTSREYAKWCAAVFERLHEAFVNYWSKAGLDVADPPRPLVVVIFADRRRYAEHSARDLGDAADRVVGYYNLLSNRVTTFDLTGSDLVQRPQGRPRGGSAAEILASPAAAGLVSTLVHEATHQMAFNCGMHRRLAPVPLWVSEGIATYFETPDLENTRGWRGVGAVNRPRLDHFLANHQAGDIEAIVAGDERFRAADGPLDAYAAAWALTRHLLDTRKREFVAYLQNQAAKQPLAADSREDRLREFEAAFGITPAALEDDVVKAMVRLTGPR